MTDETDRIDVYVYPPVSYVQYDDYGGILQYGSMAKGHVDDMITQGGNWLTDVVANFNQRVNVNTKELEPKTACEAVVQGASLTNLPRPCKVFVNQQMVEVDDGEIDFEFEQPGEYVVVVKSLTHLDGTYVVLA